MKDLSVGIRWIARALLPLGFWLARLLPTAGRVAAMLAEGPKDGSLLLVLPFAAAARLLKANDERVLAIGMWFDTPLSIVVNAKLPARNLGDLLDSAKQAGRKLVMLNSLCKSKSRTRCGCQSRPRHSLSKSSGRLPSTCLDSTPTRASQQRLQGSRLAYPSKSTGRTTSQRSSYLSGRSYVVAVGISW